MNIETLIRLVDSLKSDVNVLSVKVKIKGEGIDGFKGEAVTESIRKIRNEIKFIEKFFE